jgi:uncharacterized protein involved in outer membrane biogenesis
VAGSSARAGDVLQTTLLSIAIALIVAVLAALIGPFVIDWSAYRSLLEAEAAHLIGAPVEVKGAIDARLLPSPQVTLHNVAIGSGDERMRADELDIRFALTPILRGNWQAEEMRLAGPRLTLRLDGNGRLQAPAMSASIDPDSLSIDRLQIEGGTLTLAGENGATATLQNLFFNGRARSLFGPFDGSGAFRLGDENYTIESLSTGRVNDGAIRLRAAVQPGEHPYRIESDGTLAVAEGKPRFEGNLTLAPPSGLKRQAAPWNLSGKVAANGRSALLQNLAFVYGSDKQALKLTGDVRLDYAKAPSLTAQLRAPRLDLDQLLGDKDGGHPVPALALRQFVQWSGGAAFLPSIPVTVGLQLDEVVLGGGSLLEVAGDLKSTENGWALKPLEFRAPGFSKVSVWGDLNVAKHGVEFAGNSHVEAGDPSVLFAWLEGRGEIAPSAARPLSIAGNLTLGTEKLAVDDLNASIGGDPVTGRVTYVFPSAGQGASIDAALSADKLDLDTAFAFGKAIAAGSQFELPQSATLKASVGRASFNGLSGRDAQVDLKYGPDGLGIKTFSIADLGGAQLKLSGDLGAGLKQGRLEADLSAPELKPLLGVLARVSPAAADALESVKAAPAKLHAALSLTPAGGQGRAALKLDGTVGPAQISIDGDGAGELALDKIAGRLEGRIASADARQLVPLLRLDRAIAVGAGPGALTFRANGKASGPLTLAAEMTASGLKAKLNGTASLAGDRPAANLSVDVAEANAAPLQGAGAAALPVSYKSAVVLSGEKVSLKGIKADVSGARVAGDLDFTFGQPLRVSGKLDAETWLSAPPVLAAALGSPLVATDAKGRWVWSSEAFAPALFGKAEGDVALSANTMTLLPAIAARRFSGTVHFGAHEIAVRNIAADVGNGKLKGDLALSDAGKGITANGHVTLSGADAAALIRSGARPPLAGALGVDLSFEGSGLSPVALIGSLQGSGKLTLKDAQIAGLDPRAFDAVARAVDEGLQVETARISDLVGKALDSGTLKLRTAEAELAIAAGQLRLDRLNAVSDDASVSANGMLDLTDGMIDSHIVLSGGAAGASARPDIFMSLNGPLAEPQKSVDVSALTGWLTLRAVENQTRKLKALEEAEAKRRAEEARLRAEEETRRRAAEETRRRVEEARRRAEEDARARAEDEARLRELSDAPPVMPVLAPAPPDSALAKPDPKKKSAPADPRLAKPAAEASAAPPQPAPALPPPVTIRREPAPVWGRDIH